MAEGLARRWFDSTFYGLVVPPECLLPINVSIHSCMIGTYSPLGNLTNAGAYPAMDYRFIQGGEGANTLSCLIGMKLEAAAVWTAL